MDLRAASPPAGVGGRRPACLSGSPDHHLTFSADGPGNPWAGLTLNPHGVQSSGPPDRRGKRSATAMSGHRGMGLENLYAGAWTADPGLASFFSLGQSPPYVALGLISQEGGPRSLAP